MFDRTLFDSSWQIKNSGLMIYTIVLKKMLSNRVNKDYDPSAMSVLSFFSKYTHLREWFAMKLNDVQNHRNW